MNVMPDMTPVVRTIALERVKNGPLKEELVYFGEAVYHKLLMQLFDDGATVKLTFLVPTRRPRGRIILPKSVYQ